MSLHKEKRIASYGPKSLTIDVPMTRKAPKKKSDVQNYLLLITFWAHKTRFFTKGRTLG